MDIDDVIQNCIVGIYSDDLFNESLFLKGGQALRIKYGLKSRFSSDIDFSVQEKISDKELFFGVLEKTLYKQFFSRGFYLFDFKWVRKPKVRGSNLPDFWSGWAVEFKLIDSDKRGKTIQFQRRNALIPSGSESSKIKLDISEYEYCGSIESLRVESVFVKTYSRPLIILEKLRAICQQHPDYQFRSTVSNRARDFYDIEQLYMKTLQDRSEDVLINDCKRHLHDVFEAKAVSLDLIEKIFEESFLNIQKMGWISVESSVSGRLSHFEYYVDTLKALVEKIHA